MSHCTFWRRRRWLWFRFGFDQRLRFDQLVVAVRRVFRHVGQVARDRLAFGGQPVVGLVVLGAVAFFALALQSSTMQTDSFRYTSPSVTVGQIGREKRKPMHNSHSCCNIYFTYTVPCCPVNCNERCFLFVLLNIFMQLIRFYRIVFFNCNINII